MGAKTAAKRLRVPKPQDLARLKQFMVQTKLGGRTPGSSKKQNVAPKPQPHSTEIVEKPVLQPKGAESSIYVKPARPPPAVIGGMPAVSVPRLPAAPRATERRLRALVEQQPKITTRASPATSRTGLRSRLLVGETWRPPMKVRKRAWTPSGKYGNLHDLRVILGCETSVRSAEWTNAVFISLDCEWERRGLIDHVVEIGVATLAVRDIAGKDPQQSLEGWMPYMRYHHFVINSTRAPDTRMKSSLFAKSRFLSLEQARSELIQILVDCANASPESDLLKPKLVLLGQSIESDISVLRRQPLHKLDLLDPTSIGAEFACIMDTCVNTEYLRRKCHVNIPVARLGPAAKWLGVHPKYHQGRSLRGCHDASNDAAYALMALLLQGLQFSDLVTGRIPDMFAALAEDEVQRLRRELRKEQQRHKWGTKRTRRADEWPGSVLFWTSVLGLGAAMLGAVIVRPELATNSGGESDESDVD